jgi:hypothetical protein
LIREIENPKVCADVGLARDRFFCALRSRITMPERPRALAPSIGGLHWHSLLFAAIADACGCRRTRKFSGHCKLIVLTMSPTWTAPHGGIGRLPAFWPNNLDFLE